MGKGGFTLDDEVTNDILNIVQHFRNNSQFADYKIVLIGHSLGGMMLPRILEKLGSQVQGGIMLAANAESLQERILAQYDYLYQLQPSEQLKGEKEKLQQQVSYLLSPQFNLQTPADSLPLNLPATYWKSILDYNQVATAERLSVPLLILQGTADYQVSMRDFQQWKSKLSYKDNVYLKSYPNLNHLMMYVSAKPGPSDYLKAGHVEHVVLQDIIGWIISQI